MFFMQKKNLVNILNVFQLFWMPDSLLFECTTILTQKPNKTWFYMVTVVWRVSVPLYHLKTVTHGTAAIPLCEHNSLSLIQVYFHLLEISSARSVLVSISNFHWVSDCSDIISKLTHLFCREILSEPTAAVLPQRTLYLTEAF